MRKVRVTWDPAGSRFVAVGSADGQRVSIGAPRPMEDPVTPGGAGPGAPGGVGPAAPGGVGPAAPGGVGPGSTGFSATELLLAGAGACAAWDLVEILRKQRQDPSDLEVLVEGEQDPDAPWAYRRINLRIQARGRGLDAEGLARAAHLSVERYCSVLATVRGVSEVVYEVKVLDEVDAPEPSARLAS